MEPGHIGPGGDVGAEDSETLVQAVVEDEAVGNGKSVGLHGVARAVVEVAHLRVIEVDHAGVRHGHLNDTGSRKLNCRPSALKRRRGSCSCWTGCCCRSPRLLCLFQLLPLDPADPALLASSAHSGRIRFLLTLASRACVKAGKQSRELRQSQKWNNFAI